MKRPERLSGRGAFQGVRTSGKQEKAELISCSYISKASDLVSLSVGFSITGRSVTPVQRNRLRRLMKEAFRVEHTTLLEVLRSHGAQVLLLFTLKKRNGILPHQIRFGIVRKDIAKLTRAIALKL